MELIGSEIVNNLQILIQKRLLHMIIQNWFVQFDYKKSKKITPIIGDINDIFLKILLEKSDYIFLAAYKHVNFLEKNIIKL